MQSVSDWFTPQNYKGESTALTMAYRLNPNGSTDNRTFYLYGYSFTLTAGKTAVSLTLPKNPNVVVLAVDLSGSAAPQAAAPTFSPPPGNYNAVQSVALSDTTPGASIYYTTNNTPPSTNSTLYNPNNPIPVGSSMTIKAIAAASGYSPSSVASGAYVINLPAAAAPTFSPPPGSYNTAQSVALSDTTAGASIYYTTNATTPTTNSTLYNPNNPIPVAWSMTIEAIAAAAGFSNSAVAIGSYGIGSSVPAEVSLVSSANVTGIVNDGSAVPNGGLDGSGNAYSATLLGTSLNWNGNAYMFGAAGSADAVSNATIALPAGNFTTLSLLATAVDGNQPTQMFTVNYSDGTSAPFTQSVSDWFSPQNYKGESKALTMAYRLNPNGSADNRTFYLYGYSFTLTAGKTAMSLTLPKNPNVVVLAVDMR
jgi:hypothetical protein